MDIGRRANGIRVDKVSQVGVSVHWPSTLIGRDVVKSPTVYALIFLAADAFVIIEDCDKVTSKEDLTKEPLLALDLSFYLFGSGYSSISLCYC
ncbi:hypothetical protein V6N13_027636 [Hibiscus sabdariffa]|uniref:Uncharacterized protein n=1 Tax=Hibiscus sabdariffa TaxID=183260 RepID=A0ABR2CF64_9ROSI